ncbi:MAG: hypothetical protein M3237_00725 [Actinomycetota bacterium]|nr:hypothetical protein [Actinomycetota bacterium]
MTDPTPNSDPGAVPIVPDSSAAHTSRLDELRAALELQREADAMIAEALDTRRAAVDRAETLVRDAEQAAARAEENAATAASSRIAAAREEADRLLAEAQDQAQQITSDAQAEVTSVRNEAADLRESAQETLAAAELELEGTQRAKEHHERQLLATRTVASRLTERLERVAATLDDMLATVRGEVASARRDLGQVHGDCASSDAGGPTPSLVLQWPHDQGIAEAADSAMADSEAADSEAADSEATNGDAANGDEASGMTKHRRMITRGRRGRLRRTRL